MLSDFADSTGRSIQYKLDALQCIAYAASRRVSDLLSARINGMNLGPARFFD
jgi:hypothetical protein